MSRKFSIVKTIDVDKIVEEIDNHIRTTGEFSPYIFMSEDTMKAVEGGLPEVKWADPSLKANYKGKQAAFTGYKVFTNNDLKFGIVEIR